MCTADASLDLRSGFRLAMRRLTSTIAIITTEADGVRTGMAATSVQSLAADPPSILACVNRSASIHGLLQQARRFAVNLLHADHEALVPIYSGKVKGSERFAYGRWSTLEGVPVLDDAQASLCCILEASHSYATHEILIGRVVAATIREEIAPLLYQDGRVVLSAGSSRSNDWAQ